MDGIEYETRTVTISKDTWDEIDRIVEIAQGYNKGSASSYHNFIENSCIQAIQVIKVMSELDRRLNEGYFEQG